MCNFLSGYATEKEIKIDPFSDSHQNQIEENGDQKVETCKFEIVPDFNNFFDVSVWRFKIDQDIIPEWCDVNELELSVRNIVADLLLECPQDEEILVCSKKVLAIGGSTNIKHLVGFGVVRFMFDHSQIGGMYNNSQIGTMYNDSQIREMWDNSQIGEMHSNSQIIKDGRVK